MAGHRRHKGGHEEEHENHERWLVSYADMMTLLVALFMMMYAMSVLDVKKFASFQESLKEGLGSSTHALPGEGTPENGQLAERPGDPDLIVPAAVPGPLDAKPVVERGQLAELKEQLEAELAEAGLSGQVTLALDDRGLIVYVTDGALFASGTATLDPGGAEVLAKLAPTLAGLGNHLIVEGHTDDRPISTAQFPSNWELSTARGSAVLRFLMGPAAVTPGQINAAGYADTKPRLPNDTAANRAANRRVEIIVQAPDPVAPTLEEVTAAQAATKAAAATPAAPVAEKEEEHAEDEH